MMNSINGLDGTQELLIKLLEQNPDDWGMRKKVVWFLYEAGYFREASKVVWNAPEIPPVDKEIVFASRVVAKGQPTRAMRLLNAVIERNRSEPEKNLAMAKELVKGGMPLQAIRFYGAATLSDSKLIDEEFEICMITTDSEEDDWNEVVQGEEFAWDGPVELTEADLVCDDDVLTEIEDDGAADMAQPVPLKSAVKSMKDTLNEEEKVTDLRKDKKPLPLNPDKISTEAVTMAAYKEIENEEKEKAETSEKAEKSAEAVKVEKEVLASETLVSKTVDEVVDKTIDEEADEVKSEKEEPLLEKKTATVPVSLEKDDLVEVVPDEPKVAVVPNEPKVAVVPDKPKVVEVINEKLPVEDFKAAEVEVEEFVEEAEAIEEDEPIAAKKGMFSKLAGFFGRSKKREVKAQSGAQTLNAPTPNAPVGPVLIKPHAAQPMSQPLAPTGSRPASPMVGPVKPKPVPAPAQLQGGRKYGQPEALDCRTRLVALAPQDGSAFFQQLTEKYAKVSKMSMPACVGIAKDELDMDYIAVITDACSNDKQVNLEAFSKLLGLHAAMTEADCEDWVDDMNLLRQGFGDAVLATVVSKYSVSECRDILGAVYRRTSTKAAI